MVRIMMRYADTRLYNMEIFYNLAEGQLMGMMDPGHLSSAEAPFTNGFQDMPPQQEPSWEDLATDLHAG